MGTKYKRQRHATTGNDQKICKSFSCLTKPDSEFNQGLLAGKSALWSYTTGAPRFLVTPSYELLLGYQPYESHENHTGFINHVHPDDQKVIQKTVIQAIADTAGSIFLEFRAVHRSGKIHWFSCKGEPASDSCYRILGVLIDITEFKKTQKILSDSEHQFKTLMNNLPGMAYRSRWIDGDWEVVFVSQGAEALFGYEPSYYMTNKKAINSRLIDPDEKKGIWEIINKAISQKQHFEIVYPIVTAKGKRKWVWEKGEVIFNDRGAPSTMEGFMMDITTFKHEEVRLKSSLKSATYDRYRFGQIIGKSSAMQSIYQIIEQASASDANVLIYGESGTGKELAAKAIHRTSQRKTYPIVPVNCGAIPSTLLESEFFGYAKGAFTGAQTDKKGFLNAAQGGVLFLDEIGEISLEFQIKLLRVLDGHGYTPVGSNETQKTDIRIIAATHRNLNALVTQGKMREDFFYRIHVIPIYLPPLRERKEDIPLLIDHFLAKHRGKNEIDISGHIRDTLKAYHWPGNVRQLENTVQRYIALGNIELAPLGSDISGTRAGKAGSPVATDNLNFAVDTFEKEFIASVLKKHGWARGKTADALGVTPRTLYRKMKQYRLD